MTTGDTLAVAIVAGLGFYIIKNRPLPAPTASQAVAEAILYINGTRYLGATI